MDGQRSPLSTDRRAILWIIIVHGLFFTFLFGPRLHSDGAMYYEFLQSLSHDGDINVYDERGLFTSQYLPVFPGFDRGREETGYLAHLFTVGPALMWFPGEILVGLVSRFLGHSSTSEVSRSGYSLISMYTATFLCMLSVLAGLIILYRTLRLHFGQSESLAAVLLVSLCSQLPAYTFITPGFPHAFGFFFLPCFCMPA